jgi:hypothetical protein
MHTMIVRLSQKPPFGSPNGEKIETIPAIPNKTNTFPPNNIPFDP